MSSTRICHNMISLAVLLLLANAPLNKSMETDQRKARRSSEDQLSPYDVVGESMPPPLPETTPQQPTRRERSGTVVGPSSNAVALEDEDPYKSFAVSNRFNEPRELIVSDLRCPTTLRLLSSAGMSGVVYSMPPIANNGRILKIARNSGDLNDLLNAETEILPGLKDVIEKYVPSPTKCKARIARPGPGRLRASHDYDVLVKPLVEGADLSEVLMVLAYSGASDGKDLRKGSVKELRRDEIAAMGAENAPSACSFGPLMSETYERVKHTANGKKRRKKLSNNVPRALRCFFYTLATALKRQGKDGKCTKEDPCDFMADLKPANLMYGSTGGAGRVRDNRLFVVDYIPTHCPSSKHLREERFDECAVVGFDREGRITGNLADKTEFSHEDMWVSALNIWGAVPCESSGLWDGIGKCNGRKIYNIADATMECVLSEWGRSCET